MTKDTALTAEEKNDKRRIFYSDYVVLDTETTGLNPVSDKVIDVCAIKVENGIITDKFSTLVNSVQFIPKFITQLTGISVGMLEGAPFPEEVYPELKDFLGDSMVLGACPSFDAGFLLSNGSIEIHKSRLIDVVAISRKLLRKLPNHKLQTLARYFGISNTAHRAEGDCLTTVEVYNCLREIADEQGRKSNL